MKALAVLALVGACGGGARPSPAVVAPVELPACAVGDMYPPPEVDVARESLDVELPEIPGFELPRNADGSLVAAQLHVDGDQFLDQTVTVRARVVWIYDCVVDLRTADPSLTVAKARREIRDHPERCLRPRCTLADDLDGKRSIKVVEVPRHPNALEKQNLSKAELADPASFPPVPPLAVGDEVVVTGQWTRRGPHGDASVEGLLVYGSLRNVTRGWPK